VGGRRPHPHPSGENHPPPAVGLKFPHTRHRQVAAAVTPEAPQHGDPAPDVEIPSRESWVRREQRYLGLGRGRAEPRRKGWRPGRGGAQGGAASSLARSVDASAWRDDALSGGLVEVGAGRGGQQRPREMHTRRARSNGAGRAEGAAAADNDGDRHVLESEDELGFS
jgi:hypothetical protein